MHRTESEQFGPWSAEEFDGICFNDKRLNERWIKTADLLSRQPLAPINKACDDWANTKAAYRMFDNEKIEIDEVLRVHREKTLERAKSANTVLAIQDTTYVNYSDHAKTRGLGHIGTAHNKHVQGLIMHTTLAVSSTGLPLGILDQEVWARKETPKEGGVHHRKLPIEQKESARWIRSLIGTQKMFSGHSARVVTVGDRESDIFEFVMESNKIQGHFLIRAAWDRPVRAARSKEDEELLPLWQFMEKQPSLGQMNVEVPEKDKIPARTAQVEVRSSSVEIRPPGNKPAARKWPYVSAYAIWVKEVHPPAGVEALEWMLLTSIAIESFEDAVEKIGWYRMRWHIENFHKVLKSGCRVEECRLETADRLKRYLTLFSVIAWRLYWLTHINRQVPEQPCTQVLMEAEWKALYCKMKKTMTPSDQPPTIRQAIRWIAQLGGFLARKSDGEPGITTIWRGWQRLNDIADAWERATCG